MPTTTSTTARIYANYGCLAHEYRRVYTTAPAATAAASDPVDVILPDALRPYISCGLELCIHPAESSPYTLGEALRTAPDGAPLLVWYDHSGARHTHRLELVNS